MAPDDWSADNGSAVRGLARAMLTADHVAIATALRSLRPGMVRDVRLEVKLLLAPVWVDPNAAASAAAAFHEPPPSRRLILNTEDTAIAADYVDRITLCANNTTTIEHTGVYGEDPENQIFDAAERTILDRIPRRDDFAGWLADSGRRVVLLLPVKLDPTRTRSLLDRLTERFPGLTIFVLDRDPPGTAAADLKAVTVRPLIDAATKQRQSDYSFELQEFLRG
jgi:hypothetical protein